MATRSLSGPAPLGSRTRAHRVPSVAATRWAPGLESTEPADGDTVWLQEHLLNPHAADIVGYLRAARAAGGPVLDLGAGAGRLSVPFAHHGFEVEAVDRHGPSLARLREWAARRGPGTRRAVTTTRAELTDLRLRRTYGFALLAGAVVSALPPHARPAVFAELAAHLRPGGALALDFTAHRPAGLLREPSRFWTFPVPRFDGVDQRASVHQRFDTDTMREDLTFHVEWSDAHGPVHRVFTTTKWIVDPAELGADLRRAGLRVTTRDTRPLDGRTESVFMLCEPR